MELSQQEVQRNLLPNHKRKGVAAVVIYADPKEDEEENPTLPTAAITTLQQSLGMAISTLPVGTQLNPTLMGRVLPDSIRNKVGYGF